MQRGVELGGAVNDYNLDAIDRALLYVRETMIPADISISYIPVLRLLERRGEVNQTTIARSLGYSNPGVSRILRTLGSYKSKDGKTKGLCLVQVVRDDYNRSQTNVSLTDKGRDLVEHFNHLLAQRTAAD